MLRPPGIAASRPNRRTRALNRLLSFCVSFLVIFLIFFYSFSILSIMCDKDSPLAKKKSVTFQDLAGVSFLDLLSKKWPN